LPEVLGVISLDQSGESLICQPANASSRVSLASLLRKISKGSPRVDGPFFVLDIRTALALRSQMSSIPLDWSAEAAGYVDNYAAGYARLNEARRRLWQLRQAGVADQVLRDYAGRDGLDPHQLVAVAAMTDPYIAGICLFDEQGVGKTVMAIHAFDRLRQIGEVDTLLIFAPKNMLEEWKKDFHRFMGNKYVVRTITGSQSDKYDELVSRGDVYVTNFETAHLFEEPLRSFLLRKKGRAVLVVDESFFVKNRETRRAGAVRRLRQLCTRCWVLCGTPAPNNALDVVHQFDVADSGVTFAGVQFPKDPGSLRQTIKETVEHRGIYLRRLKRDVLPDIPQKRFEQVSVPMELEQGKLYADTLRRLVDDVGSTDDQTFKKQLTSFLARRMVLFELCSHPGQVLRTYEGLPAKHAALDGLLDELITKRDEKVVLWSFFRYSLNRLILRYARFMPVRLDGSVTDVRKRTEVIRRFQEDDQTMLFVANPAAGGAGITLTRSRIAVYESFPVQTAHYLQSIDRIHRRGQTRETHYYFLLCQNSIEEEEYDRLLTKERHSLELFGDPEPDTITREVFLADLLRALRKLG